MSSGSYRYVDTVDPLPPLASSEGGSSSREPIAETCPDLTWMKGLIYLIAFTLSSWWRPSQDDIDHILHAIEANHANGMVLCSKVFMR